MDKKAVKEWAAEYKLINEMEREELRQRLPNETVEQSFRSYFAMCELALAFSGSPDVPPELQDAREKYYIELANKWKRLSERLKHV
jgi:hypothetical protein